MLFRSTQLFPILHKALFVQVRKVLRHAILVVLLMVEMLGESVGNLFDGALAVDLMPDGSAMLIQTNANHRRPMPRNEEPQHQLAPESREDDDGDGALLLCGDAFADGWNQVEEVLFSFGHIGYPLLMSLRCKGTNNFPFRQMSEL